MKRIARACRLIAASHGCRTHVALHFLSATLATLFLVLPGLARAGVRDSVFYVAVSGNDSWSGKLAAPNTNRTDGPFASPHHARDVVRKSLAAGLHPSVRIRGGIYRFDSALLLDSQDSGSKERPVIWSACKDEIVRFMGGVTIRGFQPVRDARILGLLPGPARESGSWWRISSPRL